MPTIYNLQSDQDAVYSVLQAQKACEWGELKARLFKASNAVITQKRVFDASIELEKQGKARSERVQIQCSFPPSQPPLFRYSMSVDPRERQLTIDAKAQLLAQHYDNTKVIGAHAEQLVKKACEDLGYKRVRNRKKVGNHDIDLFAKHPSKKFWQAISVKNRRDFIREREVHQILKTVELANRKWKIYGKIRPAIVASYAYLNLSRFGVPIALMQKQVAPVSLRELCESLNDKLAFDFEVTDDPTDTMRKNIEAYIYKARYDRGQRQPTIAIARDSTNSV